MSYKRIIIVRKAAAVDAAVDKDEADNDDYDPIRSRYLALYHYKPLFSRKLVDPNPVVYSSSKEGKDSEGKRVEIPTGQHTEYALSTHEGAFGKKYAQRPELTDDKPYVRIGQHKDGDIIHTRFYAHEPEDAWHTLASHLQAAGHTVNNDATVDEHTYTPTGHAVVRFTTQKGNQQHVIHVSRGRIYDAQNNIWKAVEDSAKRGRFFGIPGVNAPAYGADEIDMHRESPAHMSSNVHKWATDVLERASRKNQRVAPSQLMAQAAKKQLFPQAEITHVLGATGLPSDEPADPAEYLSRMSNPNDFKRRAKASGDTVHGPIAIHIHQIPGETQYEPEKGMFGDYREFTSDDHLYQTTDDRDGFRRHSVAIPDSYRVIIANTPFAQPSESHFPYHSPRSIAAAHARVFSVRDPKTGKKHLHVEEVQSDVLQKRNLDSPGQHIALGSQSNWSKQMMNILVAHALATGHDGIQINSPHVMNGFWVRDVQPGMQTTYGATGDLAKHLGEFGRQFGTKMQPVDYRLDFNEPDGFMGGTRPQTSYALAAMSNPNWEANLRGMGEYQKQNVDPSDIFGTNFLRLMESHYEDLLPGRPRSGIAPARELSERFHIPASRVMDYSELLNALHYAYHLHSRNHPHPTITVQRLEFPDAMKTYARDHGIAFWGTSGPEMDKKLRSG